MGDRGKAAKGAGQAERCQWGGGGTDCSMSGLLVEGEATERDCRLHRKRV